MKHDLSAVSERPDSSSVDFGERRGSQSGEFSSPPQSDAAFNEDQHGNETANYSRPLSVSSFIAPRAQLFSYVTGN